MVTSAIIIANNGHNKDKIRESETKTPSHCTRLITSVVIPGALSRLKDGGSVPLFASVFGHISVLNEVASFVRCLFFIGRYKSRTGSTRTASPGRINSRYLKLCLS